MQRFQSRILPAVAIAILVMGSQSVYAQSMGGVSTRSTGGSTTGSSTSGRTSTGGAGTGAGSSSIGDLGSVTRGQTQNVQQSSQFIGAGGSGGFVGLGGGTQQGQLQSRGLQFQQQNQNQARQQQFNTSNRILPRPQLVIAFAAPAMAAPEITTAVGTTIDNARDLPLGDGRFAGVSFAVAEGGKVTLTGNVADSRTSQLAEMLIRLEPGVRSIENNLVVTPNVP